MGGAKAFITKLCESPRFRATGDWPNVSVVLDLDVGATFRGTCVQWTRGAGTLRLDVAPAVEVTALKDDLLVDNAVPRGARKFSVLRRNHLSRRPL